MPVAVVEEPIFGIKALGEERRRTGFRFVQPDVAAFAKLLGHARQIEALAGNIGGQIRRDERQQRIVGVEGFWIIVEWAVGHMPEPR